MASRMDTLAEEHNKIRAAMAHISANPEGPNGDLSAEQDEQTATLMLRAQAIGTELEPLVTAHRSVEATAAILASIGMARNASPVVHAPGPGVTDVSPGEYFASYCRAAHPNNPTRQQDLEAHVARFRTVATLTTSDTPGLLPTPVLGPVIKMIDAQRYVIPTLTSRPMPAAGKTFQRPNLTQTVVVDEQLAELDELVSQDIKVTSDTVTKRTFGGTLQLSQQEIDWTDPAALQIVFDDFGDIYSKRTDVAVAGSLLAAASSTVAYTATSIGTKLASLGNAAMAVYTAACVMPTDYWVSMDEAVELATTTTSEGNLVFPNIGNGRVDLSSVDLGISLPLGLKLHVVPHWAADTRVMGSAAFGEVYEDRKGFLQVAFPSTLKIELAYYGYLATYFRPAGFKKLV